MGPLSTITPEGWLAFASIVGTAFAGWLWTQWSNKNEAARKETAVALLRAEKLRADALLEAERLKAAALETARAELVAEVKTLRETVATWTKTGAEHAELDLRTFRKYDGYFREIIKKLPDIHLDDLHQ